MERYSDEAIRIIDSLHTERLDYHSEYIPLIDAAQRLAAYENTCLEPEDILGATDMAKVACALRELNKYKHILGDDYDIDRLRELVQADRDGRRIVSPAKIGDKVYHITTCENFKKIYDGTLYGDDGGPGTATGLYCPCELAETCPFPCDEDGWFDCYDHKNEIEIFEDVVTEIVIGDTLDYVGFEYSGAAEFEEFGKTVFLTREAAEAALKAQKG